MPYSLNIGSPKNSFSIFSRSCPSLELRREYGRIFARLRPAKTGLSAPSPQAAAPPSGLSAAIPCAEQPGARGQGTGVSVNADNQSVREEQRRKRAARIESIKAIEPQTYTPKSLDKKAAKALFSSFAPVKKSFTTDFFESNDPIKKIRDNRETANQNRELDITFPKGTVGKLRGIFNTFKDNIAADIKPIFDSSQYAYSSNYIRTNARADGSIHKQKPNIDAYHHFANKVIVDGKPYYVRFTVEELKGNGQLHAAQVSEVEIVNVKSWNGAAQFREENPVGTAPPVYDDSLAEFFNSVNNNNSGSSDPLLQLDRIAGGDSSSRRK